MNARILLLGILPLAFVGCVYSHHNPDVVYYTPAPGEPVGTLPPTSDSPAVRVYPGSPPASAHDSDVLSSDLAVARSIRNLLKYDSNLSAASERVMVKVDGGVVKLRGTVPTEHDKDEMIERISRIPGVREVQDHLGIGLQ